MSIIKILGFAFLVCLFLCLLPTKVSAQTEKRAESAQPDRDQTLRQLLTEVHELRLAVQRVTVYHSQVAEMKAEKPRMEQ